MLEVRIIGAGDDEAYKSGYEEGRWVGLELALVEVSRLHPGETSVIDTLKRLLYDE